MRRPPSSPWVREVETSEDRAERLQADNVEPNRHVIVFRGPAHAVTVAIHTYDTDKALIRSYAISVLGECVAEACNTLKDTDTTLQSHAISFDPKTILTQKVKLTLGDTQLYAKASSNDLNLATNFALDRLAAALSELAMRHPKFAAFLQDNDVSIARSSRV